MRKKITMGWVEMKNRFKAGLRIRIQLFTLMRVRVRILLLIKVIRICDHRCTGPPGLHFEPPRLHADLWGLDPQPWFEEESFIIY